MENNNTHSIDKICVNINTFKDYYLNNNYNDNMFNIDGSLNRNYNSSKKTGLIAKIFDDHWPTFSTEEKQFLRKYRPNAEFEIEKNYKLLQ